MQLRRLDYLARCWLVGIGTLAIPGPGAIHRCWSNHGGPRGRRRRRSSGRPHGTLIGMGIQEYKAKRYEGRVKDVGILLSVHSDNSAWTKKAK